MRVFFLPLIILVFAGALACTDEPEITVTPEPVPEEIEGATWDELPVSYCTVRDEEAGFVSYERFVELTREAFEAWDMPVDYDGDCPGPPETGNGRNEVYWGTLGDEQVGHKAGRTELRYVGVGLGATPSIVEANIAIHDTPPADLDGEDCLLTTLMHEVGHFFGLHHLEPPALMAPVITECAPELTDSDREALEALYSEQAAGPQLP